MPQDMRAHGGCYPCTICYLLYDLLHPARSNGEPVMQGKVGFEDRPSDQMSVGDELSELLRVQLLVFHFPARALVQIEVGRLSEPTMERASSATQSDELPALSRKNLKKVKIRAALRLDCEPGRLQRSWPKRYIARWTKLTSASWFSGSKFPARRR